MPRRLEYEADKGASLEHLQDRYAKFLQGVLVEEANTESVDGTAVGGAEGETEAPHSAPEGDQPRHAPALCAGDPPRSH